MSLKNGATNGGKQTLEYRIWTNMKARCTNPKNPDYKRYGGRGIKVCNRWLHSFSAFLADMGRTIDGMTIERKDTNGNYTPKNCCWASRKTQNNNRRDNVKLTFQGKTMTRSQWADKIGVSHQTLISRLNQMGWPIARALTTPSRKHN